MFKNFPSTSPKGKLDLTDFQKATRDGLVFAGATFLTYLIGQIPNMNFGDHTQTIAPILGVVVSLLYRLYRDNTKLDDLEQGKKKDESK